MEDPDNVMLTTQTHDSASYLTANKITHTYIYVETTSFHRFFKINP